MDTRQEIKIESRDYWFKVIEFLQQNWALIDEQETSVVVWFFGDTFGVFDELHFKSLQEAVEALGRNGFQRYVNDPDASNFIALPKGPFFRSAHPNGAIYSSGRFWE